MVILHMATGIFLIRISIGVEIIDDIVVIGDVSLGSNKRSCISIS